MQNRGTGSKQEPIWWISQIAGRLESTRRIREIRKTGGLNRFKSCDWSEHVRIENQHGNSCLGFSRSQCVWLWQVLRGMLPQFPPDPYRAYWYARAMHHDTNDNGTYTGSIWTAGEDFGDIAFQQTRSPIRELTEPPPANEDARAVDVKVKARPIFATGKDLIDRICDSLALFQPVQLSLKVDQSFLADSGPSLVDTPTNPMVLGHAVAVVGCRESLTPGKWPELLIANSWGLGWRNNGCVWITGEYAAQAYGVWYVESVGGIL